MKKILLCCAAGMSTSLLVTKMKQNALEKGVPVDIWAVSIDEINANLEKGVDVVLLGPQIKYKFKDVKVLCDGKGVPCDVINMIDYGSMNGKKVLEFALGLSK